VRQTRADETGGLGFLEERVIPPVANPQAKTSCPGGRASISALADIAGRVRLIAIEAGHG
jgi:hypothetical protein